MRYYRGKPMKDYKPKYKVFTVETFFSKMKLLRIPLILKGNEAYDADGDRRIILKLKQLKLKQ